MQADDDRAIFHALPDELPVIAILSLCRDPMSQCGRPVRRAVSRPVCADTENPPLSVDRKLLGTYRLGPHPARPAPAVAPHDPLRSADACRRAIGRPILLVDACADAQLAAAQAKLVRTRMAERLLPVLTQAMGSEGLRETYPFGRDLAGARVAPFVDGSSEMLLDRIAALIRPR